MFDSTFWQIPFIFFCLFISVFEISVPNMQSFKKGNTVVNHVLLKVKTCTQPWEASLENRFVVLEHRHCRPVPHLSKWLLHISVAPTLGPSSPAHSPAWLSCYSQLHS